jgi:hypothetical protein
MDGGMSGSNERISTSMTLSSALDASYVKKLPNMSSTTQGYRQKHKNTEAIHQQHHPGHNHKYAYLYATTTLSGTQQLAMTCDQPNLPSRSSKGKYTCSSSSRVGWRQSYDY